MTTSAHQRRGMSLVELIIALATATLIATVATATIVRDRRLHHHLDTAISIQANTRDANSILTTTLRATNTSDTLPLVSDTAIELRTVLGAATLCDSATPGTTTLTIAPETGSPPLTSIVSTPEPGDELALPVRPSTTTIGWTRHTITSARTGAATCDPAWRALATSSVPPASRAIRIATSSPVTRPLAPGTPLRLTRRARLDIYRASDQYWYLGYRRCPGGSCTSVQPAAGHFGDHSVHPAMTFHAFDRAGYPIAGEDVTGIARIEVTIRSVRPALAGFAPTPDSTLLAIAAH